MSHSPENQTKEIVPYYSPLEETKDALTLLCGLANRFPDRSEAVDILIKTMLREGQTLAVTRIKTLKDLTKFLEDKCDYRFYRENPDGSYSFTSYNPNNPTIKADPDDFGNVNVDHMYTSLQTMFVIIHPPSEYESSNAGRWFLSMAKHNFTPYSNEIGPTLRTENPDPPGFFQTILRTYRGAKYVVPFELVTNLDHTEAAFCGRAGVYEDPYLPSVVINDRLGDNPHEGPTPSYEAKPRVYVPLKKDDQTIDGSWQVYAISCDKKTPIDYSFIPKIPNPSPFREKEKLITKKGRETGVYQTYAFCLRTGLDLLDDPRTMTRAVKVTTALTIMGVALFYLSKYPDNPLALENLKSSLNLCCCAGLAPLIPVIYSWFWCVHKDFTEDY